MFQKALAVLAAEVPKARLGAPCLSYLRDHGVSESLITTLDECAYAGDIRVKRLWLAPLGELHLDNQLEENRACIEHGLLVVGSGLNGDPVALQISTGKMAFVSHDLLWEGDYQAFDECVMKSPLEFGEFWTAALEDVDFPVDWYAARDRWAAA
jgi:hypothetical protein